jgi:hypothetical protein
LIAKSLRTIPANYTRPLRNAPAVEAVLRGTIYDPYVRRVMHEGLLPGSGSWATEVPAWLTCPERAAPTAWTRMQRVLGLQSADAGEEFDDGLVCPYHWAQAVHPLNCALIWPKALDLRAGDASAHADADADEDAHRGCHHHTDVAAELAAAAAPAAGPPHSPPGPSIELDTPEYAGRIARERVLERLMAQAGVRLAAILNTLFVAPDELARGTGVVAL